MKTKQLFSLKEIAEMTGRSRPTVRGWRDKGLITSYIVTGKKNPLYSIDECQVLQFWNRKVRKVSKD